MTTRQIVKTQKRAVFLTSPNSTNDIIGLTASAYWNYSNSDGATAGEIAHRNGSITGGSAALSKVVCGHNVRIEQKGDVIFQCTGNGDFSFERFTIKSASPGVTAAITTGPHGTTITEFVL
jgi:hypothetical protein